jgi:hypothetical protein
VGSTQVDIHTSIKRGLWFAGGPIALAQFAGLPYELGNSTSIWTVASFDETLVLSHKNTYSTRVTLEASYFLLRE